MIGENRIKKGSGVVITGGAVRPRTINLVAGIDAGSTQTRVCLADNSDVAVFNDTKKTLEALKQVYLLPSTYATASDNREILPASNNLEDNYDSTIICVGVQAERPLLSRHRILRGRKMNDVNGVVPRYMDSSTNKSDNYVFYTNIIDALGYAILQKYNGDIPSDVNIQMFLSVRPKEMATVHRTKMIENLVGSFVFAWRDIKINLNIKSLDFSTEPEAQVFGTTTMADLRYANGEGEKYKELADTLSNTSTYIHIEGGGSSIGVEVVRNGQLVDSCSATFPLGGNYMQQTFIDRMGEIMGRTVSPPAAEEALKTTLLRDGRETLDVADVVSDCKNQVAMDIVERMRHGVLDLNHWLAIQDVEFISLGGRLFLPDEQGCTISEYLEGYVHQMSPNTEIIVLGENCIPQGNLVMGVNSALDSGFLSLASAPAVNVAPAHNEPQNDSASMGD